MDRKLDSMRRGVFHLRMDIMPLDNRRCERKGTRGTETRNGDSEKKGERSCKDAEKLLWHVVFFNENPCLRVLGVFLLPQINVYYDVGEERVIRCILFIDCAIDI